MIDHIANRHLFTLINLWADRVLFVLAAVIVAVGIGIVVHAMRKGFPTMTRPTTELHHAWSWDCSECGQYNFARSITMSPEMIDLDEVDDVGGVDADDIRKWISEGGSGEFTTKPGVVRCAHCGEQFDTADDGFDL